MIPVDGRRQNQAGVSAYADLTPGTSYTLPHKKVDVSCLSSDIIKASSSMAATACSSLPNINTDFTGSRFTLTRTLPRLKERIVVNR